MVQDRTSRLPGAPALQLAAARPWLAHTLLWEERTVPSCHPPAGEALCPPGQAEASGHRGEGRPGRGTRGGLLRVSGSRATGKSPGRDWGHFRAQSCTQGRAGSRVQGTAGLHWERTERRGPIQEARRFPSHQESSVAETANTVGGRNLRVRQPPTLGQASKTPSSERPLLTCRGLT